MDIIYHKPCRGSINRDKGQVTTRDFPRANIKSIIDNFKPILKRSYDEGNISYLGKVDKVRTYIHQEISKQTIGRSDYETYICPVDKFNYDKLGKTKETPEYLNMILSGKSPEKEYFIKIGGLDIFYYENRKYVIIPDFW